MSRTPALRLRAARAASLVLLAAAALASATLRAQMPQAWQDLPVGDGTRTIRAPRDEPQLLAEAHVDASAASDARLAGAPWWLRQNRPEIASIAGLDAVDLPALARTLQSPLHVVFARWNAETASLAVDVLLVRRLPAPGGWTVQVLAFPFTPAHGGRWAAARTYLPPAQARADRSAPGRNPFAAFAGAPDDPVFHRIGPAAAEVVAGHAMSHYRASAALLALTRVEPSVTQSTGGNWLRRTVTTTVTGTSQVAWRIALPGAALAPAGTVAICVDPTPCLDAACTRRAPCPDASLVATSRAAFDDWTGGSLAQAPQEIYRASTTRSSSNGLFLAFLGAFVLVPGNFDPVLLGIAAALYNPGPAPYAPAFSAGPAQPVAVSDGVLVPPPPASPEQAAMDAREGELTLASPGAGASLAALDQAWIDETPDPSSLGAGASRLLPSWLDEIDRCRAAGLSGADLAACAGLVTLEP